MKKDSYISFFRFYTILFYGCAGLFAAWAVFFVVIALPFCCVSAILCTVICTTAGLFYSNEIIRYKKEMLEERIEEDEL